MKEYVSGIMDSSCFNTGSSNLFRAFTAECSCSIMLSTFVYLRKFVLTEVLCCPLYIRNLNTNYIVEFYLREDVTFAINI